MEAAESPHLPPEAVTVKKALLHAMKTVCWIHMKSFRKLHDTHEFQGGEDPTESVH